MDMIAQGEFDVITSTCLFHDHRAGAVVCPFADPQVERTPLHGGSLRVLCVLQCAAEDCGRTARPRHQPGDAAAFYENFTARAAATEGMRAKLAACGHRPTRGRLWRRGEAALMNYCGLNAGFALLADAVRTSTAA